MRRWPHSLLLLGTLAGLSVLLASPAGRAQNAAGNKGMKVKFFSGDGVELHGTFFGGGGKQKPCVLMLHAVGKGEESHKPGWDALAQALQKAGYSVLTFDFRGHGLSTSVNPQQFWSPRPPVTGINARLFKANPADPSTIDITTAFLQNPAFYPVLANDVAAAKAFLDQKNDAGECNTSSLVLIGAETGATVGAIWLNSEWHRYTFNQRGGFQPAVGNTPEGKNVMGAVWLSISPKLGQLPVSLPTILGIAVAKEATPMTFLYSDGDKEGKTVANDLTKVLKKNGNPKYSFIGPYSVGDLGKAKGRELLRPDNTKKIVEYLDKVEQERGSQWNAMDFRLSQYVWRPPFGALIPAKPAGDTTFLFNTYAAFLR
jgi:hypothetical protein